MKRYDMNTNDDHYPDPQGDWMRASEVLEYIRQCEYTLPDYTDDTYSNDQICDVAYVKRRLREALG